MPRQRQLDEWNTVKPKQAQTAQMPPKPAPSKTNSLATSGKDNTPALTKTTSLATSGKDGKKVELLTDKLTRLARQEKSPEKIPMEIKVADKMVYFEYLLKTDTPEKVSGECCKYFKFNPKQQGDLIR